MISSNFKIYFLGLLICFSSVKLISQTFEDHIKYGDEALSHGDYYNAMVFYGKAIKEDSSDLDIIYRYAETCRLFNNYKEAEKWYRYVFLNDNKERFPLSLFWLAVVNKNNGHYVKAGSNFKAYYNRFKNEKNYYSEKAEFEIESCKYALNLIKDTIPVKIEHLDDHINSPYSEFGAIQLKDSMLIFSALRQIVSSEFETFLSGVYLSKIYESKITLAGYTRAKAIESNVNSKDEHTANITLNDDYQRVYFTKCEELDNANLICAIYYIERVNGKWIYPVKLPDNINLKGYTATQPSILDGEDEDVLYFVSNRPGGQGGLDIWFSVYKEDKFNDPVNLGSIINSQGNEISPFYHEKSGKIYFSSDWHQGLGGYDIFFSNGNLSEWSKPENIGYPLNTSYNDMYYTINRVDSEGFVTSNRPGSFFIKGETCCNDIFYYEWFDVSKADSVVPDTQKIEEKIKELLPLTLYFHNDIPDPGSKETTTLRNYKETLVDYFSLKEKYKKEYSKGLSGDERIKAQQDIEDFFNDYVGRGFLDLEKLSSLLLQDLENGNHVNITIKGFTSPLNTAEYNENLANLNDYENDIFKPYLKGSSENGGKLVIIEDPIGEAQASNLVSDNPNDIRNSVYSRAAALERRIQIILYSSDLASPRDQTEILFNTNYHDFGKLGDNEKVTFIFSFENIGENDLVISSIEATCGCTAYEYPRDPIKPGDFGEIRILFDSHGKKGIQEESLILDANIPNGYIILGISAYIPE
ncbi:DUF1573 domain-containing protein [candidate division KSB1 bacterium]